MPDERGPAWLGIGAQRCGTTWFTELLTQHPAVVLPTGTAATEQRRGSVAPSDKEMHALQSSLITGFSAVERERYLSLFETASGARPGEFTPYYLRALWVPEVARRVCREGVVLIVLLRDPVARFESAMRHMERSAAFPGEEPTDALRRWVNAAGADAQWAGMYASHLEGWARTFDRAQLIVLQYERVRMDPLPALEAVWRRLGLDPVPLVDVDRPSATSTDRSTPWRWDRLPGLRERLTELYRPEIERLVAHWGIDPALWASAGGVVAAPPARRRRWRAPQGLRARRTPT